MNPIEKVLRRIDRAQQSHTAPAFAFAVVKKFGDDRGGGLAALITYYGFLATFPLLLLLVTILGFVLDGRPDLQESILDSAVAQFPVIGGQLRENLGEIDASGIGLVVGAVGLLWGAMGVTQVSQLAMSQIWNVPGVDRPGFPLRAARGLGVLAVIGIGMVASTFMASLSVATALPILGPLALLALINVVMYLLAFRVLTPNEVPMRDLVVGAVVAGVVWTLVQTFAAWLVDRQLRNSSELYGTFAYVLGSLAWLYLAARIALYAAELNVVRARHLWPRSILQPPLTPADERVLADIALMERRRPEQEVAVDFEEPHQEERLFEP